MPACKVFVRTEPHLFLLPANCLPVSLSPFCFLSIFSTLFLFTLYMKTFRFSNVSEFCLAPLMCPSFHNSVMKRFPVKYTWDNVKNKSRSLIPRAQAYIDVSGPYKPIWFSLMIFFFLFIFINWFYILKSYLKSI